MAIIHKANNKEGKHHKEYMALGQYTVMYQMKMLVIDLALKKQG